MQIRGGEIAAQILAAERLHLRHVHGACGLDGLIKTSGSSALRDDNCVQCCWRDVRAISSHVVTNFDVAAENFGQAEFGVGRTKHPVF